MYPYDNAMGNKPKYNTFDLSHDKRLTMKMGELVPVMAIDVLPGDKFTVDTSHLTRFLPLVAPVMHNVKVKVRYFFSPNRLVWPNWEDFITGPESATDTVEPTHPYVNAGVAPSSLQDYMGVGTATNQGGLNPVDMNALPFAHYQFIWNEYFRDQNLQSEVDYELTDGSNSIINLLAKRTVAWSRDRFTSALPFTQKGPEVSLPIVAATGTGPNGLIPLSFVGANQGNANPTGLTNVSTLQVGELRNAASSNNVVFNLVNASGSERQFQADVTAHTFVDPAEINANAATINELRQAMAIQKWLELNARTGNRYTEHIQAHFGVKPQDARLQRPEEFGGSVSNIQFSEVLQTAGTTSTGQDASALGTMGGHAMGASGSEKSSYYAQEHGWIFAFMYVVPDTAYYQGVPKKFTKVDRYDYYQPLLAHLGEQPVKKKEIYATGTSTDDDTFGYLPIYDEYRHEQSGVAGLMKSDLEHWHLARKFGSVPNLNETFITVDATDRIFAVAGEEQIIAHVYNDVKAQRKIAYYGTPMGL
jgi:hypothetical protein